MIPASEWARPQLALRPNCPVVLRRRHHGSPRSAGPDRPAYDAVAAKASRFGEIFVHGGIPIAILNSVVSEVPAPDRDPSF